MLAFSSPFCPPLEWEYQYPIDDELGTNQATFDNLDFDSMFANFDSSSNQTHQSNDNDRDNNNIIKQQSESSPSQQGTTSTTDDYIYDDIGVGNPVLAKKLNHNASERDRRKKINSMYSALRSLLPATVTDHRKKLSIPMTVGKVVEYIPELQKEVKDLSHKKKVLTSKLSALQQQQQQQEQVNNNISINIIEEEEVEYYEETKPKNTTHHQYYSNSSSTKGSSSRTTSSCSISVNINKMGDNDKEIIIMVIQISAFERIIISIAEVLLLLHNFNIIIIDVSSFQSFGGITFYNIHFLMENNHTLNLENLNQALMSLLTKHKQIN